MSADNGSPNYEGESIAGFPDFVEGYLLAIEERERQENDYLDFEMMDMDVLQDEFENLLAPVAPMAPVALLPLLPPMAPLAPLAPLAPEVPYLEDVDMVVNDLNFDLLEHGLPPVEPVFENDDESESCELALDDQDMGFDQGQDGNAVDQPAFSPCKAPCDNLACQWCMVFLLDF